MSAKELEISQIRSSCLYTGIGKSNEDCSSDIFEAMQAAGIIGTKLAANEFVAYLPLTEGKETLSPQTVAILSVALCNFANFSSIGQLIVGLGSLEPSKLFNTSSVFYTIHGLSVLTS